MGFPSQTADSFRYTTEEISVNLCFTPGKNLSEKYKMNRLKKKKRRKKERKAAGLFFLVFTAVKVKQRKGGKHEHFIPTRE